MKMFPNESETLELCEGHARGRQIVTGHASVIHTLTVLRGNLEQSQDRHHTQRGNVRLRLKPRAFLQHYRLQDAH